MCGIGGLVGDFLPGLMGAMNATQKHRGPDGEGIFEDADNGVALAHVRLAILDLTQAAAQPMYSSDGRFVLSYNGEIYNYKELRSELIERGCKFSSTGDTEVLLQALREWGPGALGRLNGMFAFALWDRLEKTLLLVRDPIGIKPLYYAQPGQGSLLFASEIKAMLADRRLPARPDPVALQQHLAYGHASSDRTAFEGIRRLQPGHMLVWRANSRKREVKRYWHPTFTISKTSRHRAVEHLRSSLTAAVSKQLVSDVPLGVLASGGLDSSAIAVMACKDAKERMQAFTTRFEDDGALDTGVHDLPYARKLSASLGIPLVERTIDPDVVSRLPRLIYHLDEPLADPAIFACFALCEEARRHGRIVLLSGQGGDELFCGYPRYWVMHLTRGMSNLPHFLKRGLARAAEKLPGAAEGRAGIFARRVRRALFAMHEPQTTRFLGMCSQTPQAVINSVLSADFKSQVKGDSFMDDCLAHMQQSGLHGLWQMQDRDLSIYLPNHNLLYTDKLGMAAGTEVRVPLLDLDIVKEVLSYPYDWQLAGWRTKTLFRDAVRGVVPGAIIRRSKQGFGAPFRKWLRYDLRDLWADLASESALKARGWFDYAGVRRIRELSQAGKQDLYMLQWGILTLELWAREFLDKRPVAAVAQAA